MSTPTNPRAVVRGNVIHSKNTDTDETVRDVSVVIHLLNGTDEVYHSNEPVQLTAEREELPDLPNDLVTP